MDARQINTSELESRIIQVFTPIDALICTVKGFRKRDMKSGLVEYIRLHYNEHKYAQKMSKIEKYQRLLALNREYGKKVPIRLLKNYFRTACGVAMCASMVYHNTAGLE